MVHCWEEPYVFAGNRALAMGGFGRLVYYSHQNISKSYPVPFNWLERLSIRRASGWIAGGHTAEEALCQRAGYVDKPRRVISLGVDLEQFQPNGSARSAIRKALGWSQSGPPVVGFLGRFVPEKGVGVLTAALNALATGWRALWVGGGPCEGDLRSWAAKFPDDRVRIVTGVPHDDVPQYLNAMDILAAPSQTTARWKEQFGRMLIEAMGCGVPVLGSSSGEIPYVIGTTGEVIGETDITGWTQSIGALLESPARRGVERRGPRTCDERLRLAGYRSPASRFSEHALRP